MLGLLYISPQGSCERIRGQTKSMICGVFQRFRLSSVLRITMPATSSVHPRFLGGYTTIVDFHASIQSSKNISGMVKAHEVHAVVTSLQLFNKVDLQAVMKAGRWASGGTFTSFYLRDLCPQADCIRKTRAVVAAGEIVEFSS